MGGFQYSGPNLGSGVGVGVGVGAGYAVGVGERVVVGIAVGSGSDVGGGVGVDWLQARPSIARSRTSGAARLMRLFRRVIHAFPDMS